MVYRLNPHPTFHRAPAWGLASWVGQGSLLQIQAGRCSLRSYMEITTSTPIWALTSTIKGWIGLHIYIWAHLDNTENYWAANPHTTSSTYAWSTSFCHSFLWRASKKQSLGICSPWLRCLQKVEKLEEGKEVKQGQKLSWAVRCRSRDDELIGQKDHCQGRTEVRVWFFPLQILKNILESGLCVS